ncbi:hypothetical protein FB451DRAFT_1370983 [Mycena latifolia]|nr:hypothetical protein FB451DRAFT_1370983 [Mycena latifolia]
MHVFLTATKAPKTGTQDLVPRGRESRPAIEFKLISTALYYVGRSYVVSNGQIKNKTRVRNICECGRKNEGEDDGSWEAGYGYVHGHGVRVSPGRRETERPVRWRRGGLCKCAPKFTGKDSTNSLYPVDSIRRYIQHRTSSYFGSSSFAPPCRDKLNSVSSNSSSTLCMQSSPAAQASKLLKYYLFKFRFPPTNAQFKPGIFHIFNFTPRPEPIAHSLPAGWVHNSRAYIQQAILGLEPVFNFDFVDRYHSLYNRSRSIAPHARLQFLALELEFYSLRQYASAGPNTPASRELAIELPGQVEFEPPIDNDSSYPIVGCTGLLVLGNRLAVCDTRPYQLALRCPELNGPISRSAETDPSVIGRGMDVQLRSLILEPCKLLKHASSQIVIIDGLDECESQRAQQEILRLIGSTFNAQPRPLRFLIASRPEPHIREKFEDLSLNGLYRSVNIEQAFEDVRIYLRDEFSRIHHQHHKTMGHIPIPWPRGIFWKSWSTSPQRLAAVVGNLPTECGTPFHALDELYSQILHDTPFQSHLLDILCAVVHGSMLQLSTKNIEELLGLDTGDVKLTLRHLQSLLLVPQDETHSISMHHKSFRDFLIDPIRSGKFHIGLKQRKDLARSILRALSHSPANKARPSLNQVGWKIGFSGLEYITSMIPPSADLPAHTGEEDDPLAESFDLEISKWCRPITAHLSDAACHAVLSQSPGLLRILQAWWVCRIAFPWMTEFRMDGLLYIRFLLHIPWDELWAIVRALHSLVDSMSIEQASILLRFTLRSTTICPEVYPWPSTCRDLARGCIRLLPDQDGLPVQSKTLILSWAKLIRLSPPCDDLLADIHDLSPSPEMDGFDIHNSLEWLKTFPQPPLDVVNRWQGYLDKHRLNFYCPKFKKYEEWWDQSLAQ